MALPVTTLGAAIVTPAAKAAPIASEVIALAGAAYALLDVDVGATATTITIPRPGTHAAGDSKTTLTTGAVTSQTRMIPLLPEYADANGNVTINFSQVASVSGRVILCYK